MREHLTIDGRRLDVDDRPGPDDRAPLVLLHEGLGSLDLWRKVPDALLERVGPRRLVNYSRWGYGRSEALDGPRPVTYMHHEADVVLPALRDRLGLERPVLIGHSDGASIALAHAGAGHEVAALVVLAPHVICEDRSVEGIEAAREAYATTDLREKLARHHDDVDGAFRGWNDAWLSPGFRDWDLTDRLPGITCPVLCVQGVDDAYGTMRQIDLIEAGVSGPVTRVELPGVGHAPQFEAPEATLGAVEAFIRDAVRDL